MKFITQLRLLLWKNLLLQKTNYFVTFLEVALPIGLVYLSLKLRNLGPTPKYEAAVLYSPHDVFHRSILPKPVFKHVPDTALVKRVMSELADRMVYRGVVNESTEVKVQGFNTETELQKYFDKDKEQIEWIGIVFEGFDTATTLPQNVTFTLRPKYINEGSFSDVKFHPDFKYPLSPPPDETQYRSEGWLSLQAMISETLMTMWGAPKTIKFDVFSRCLPYPSVVTDVGMRALEKQMPILFVLSFIVSVFHTTKTIVYEKERKIKESMKLMGLMPSAYWVSWFLTFYVYLALVMVVYTIMLTAHVHDVPLLRNVDGLLVYVFLLIYAAAIMSYAIMMSTFFDRANVAAGVSGGVFFMAFVPFGFLVDGTDYTTKMLSSLVFNTAVAIGVNAMAKIYHRGDEGVRWSNYGTPTYPDTVAMRDSMMMLMVDTVIHLLVTWYMDTVFPGEFGVPQPYYFFLTKKYWCGEKPKVEPEVGSDYTHSKYFERDPKHLKAGIKLRNLRKVYTGGKVAVQSLTLNMYEGHITVLLGHNGAGKTTTMFMLSGFFPPTSGTAYVNGYNIKTDITHVRSSLGLCPQHDILYNWLTVEQHLYFFARLKGCPTSRVWQEVELMIKETGLENKRKAYADTLSGGQKRRLSAGIALINGSKVVILDEPTSGVDPTARRQIWDLLLRHRAGRTLLLSTHFMDEADALGNRIAIMAKGKLVCCGTSMFLKKLCGTGYHLTIVKVPGKCSRQKVTKVVKSHIAKLKAGDENKRELHFLLPNNQVSKFPALFRQLEVQKEELGILCFGASASTMEDVFLRMGQSMDSLDNAEEESSMADLTAKEQRTAVSRFGMMQESYATLTDTSGLLRKDYEVPADDSATFQPGDQSTKVSSEEGDANNANRSRATVTMTGPSVEFSEVGGRQSLRAEYVKLRGIDLQVTRMRAIVVKKVIHMWRSRMTVVIQLIMPVLFTTFAMLTKSEWRQFTIGPVKFDLHEYRPSVITYMTASEDKDVLEVGKVYSKLFHPDDTVRQLNASSGSMSKQLSLHLPRINVDHIVGAKFEESDTNATMKVTVFFNGYTFNAEPISLNYVMNAFTRYFLKGTHTISSGIRPFLEDIGFGYQRIQSKRYREPFNRGPLLARYVCYGMAFMLTLFVHFLIKERSVGAKHMQTLSGVEPLVFWLTNFLFDFAIYLVPVVFMLIVFVVFDDPAFVEDDMLGVVTVALLAYGWAVLPSIYFAQFFFQSPPTGAVLSIIYHIVTGATLSYALNSLQSVVRGLHMRFLTEDWSDPKTHHLKAGLEEKQDALTNLFHPSDLWGGILFPDYAMITCLRMMGDNYLRKDTCKNLYKYSCGPEYLNFACCNRCDSETCFAFDVTNKTMAWKLPGVGRYLTCLLAQGAVFILLTVLVETELGRMITSVLKDPAAVVKTAVPLETDMGPVIEDSDVAEERRRINSTPIAELSKHDSLVLVNLYKQNGAGKTTIFKMLTGDVMMTKGTAYVKGHDIRHHLKTVQSNLGYCPQFDALHDQMTARETLTMYARLRGVPEMYIDGEVDKLLDLFKISAIADNESRTYSGGNKRKLSTAIALIGDPHFVLLDEPSSGMDAAAKRTLWNALSVARSSGKTLILTSHSMEECEALCTRLAIMVNGRFMCLGSTQHLKHKFGQGYTLIAKMNDLADGSPMPHEPFIEFVLEKFPSATIFEVHEGYVHLQVADTTVPIADLFEQMHFAKRTLNVQYYIVQQTSLEQVFLSFTRQQILPLLTVSPWERFYHSFCCCLVSQSEVQQERSETLRTHDRRVHSIAPV